MPTAADCHTASATAPAGETAVGSGSRGADDTEGTPPSRCLWLLRHAKATTDAPQGGGDKSRPLAPRGRQDAIALGRRLAAGTGVFGLAGLPVPELIVCSAAVRTRQTADLVSGAMGGTPSIEAFHSLYGATPGTVLRSVTELDDGIRSTLVIGHNPTMFQLAWDLLSADDPAGTERSGDRERLRLHGFPTCALAVIAFDTTSWADVAGETGRLEGVFHPPY